ncbi:Crp/Fnr family transcriptional regulator [Pontivivens ytuae]|nr:helix-turn-helix domain-containing protein [Pontivivens ytuae]
MPVVPSCGHADRIHHEATCDTVVRSRHVDTGTEPGLASRLLASTDRRIARDGARIVRLAGGRPVPSLSAMILDLLDRGCGDDAGADVLRMPISRAEVASYLGFEPETVSRAFAALKRSGTILRHGWATVDVVDRARLHALSEV